VCVCEQWVTLTVDVDVGIGEIVSMFVADIALNDLSIFHCHIHKRQVIQQTAKSSFVILQRCNAQSHCLTRQMFTCCRVSTRYYISRTIFWHQLLLWGV